MTTALSKLREQVIEAFTSDQPWEKKTLRLKAGLDRKFAQLVTGTVAKKLNRPWTKDAGTFVNYHIDEAVVNHLLYATADLRFFLASLAGITEKRIVFDSPAGSGVECYRDGTTLLINATGKQGETESWSRCLSISKSTGRNAYDKHLYVPNYRGGEAKYGERVLPQVVEWATVRRGVGYQAIPGRLFFYGRFALPVGHTGNAAARVETCFLKVQLDRVQRPCVQRLLKNGSKSRRLDGKEVHMHGYPISEVELRKDFPAGADLVLATKITI